MFWVTKKLNLSPYLSLYTRHKKVKSDKIWDSSCKSIQTNKLHIRTVFPNESKDYHMNNQIVNFPNSWIIIRTGTKPFEQFPYMFKRRLSNINIVFAKIAHNLGPNSTFTNNQYIHITTNSKLQTPTQYYCKLTNKKITKRTQQNLVL